MESKKPKTLDEIPEELILFITEHLSLEDLKSFRCTCRVIAHKSEHDLTSRICRISCTFTRASFNCLQVMSQHTFAGKVNELHFKAFHVNFEDYERLLRHKITLGPDDASDLARIQTDMDAIRDAFAERYNQEELHQILSVTFRNLVNLKLVKLVEEKLKPPDQDEGWFQKPLDTISPVFTSWATGTLLSAIHDSNIHLDTLKLRDLRNDGEYYSFQERTRHITTMPIDTRALQNVRELSLRCDEKLYDDSAYEALGKILRASTALESLKFSTVDDRTSKVMHYLARNMHVQNLRRLKLQDATSDGDDLYYILQNHKQSLQELHVGTVFWVNDNDWCPSIEVLRETPRLENVRFDCYAYKIDMPTLIRKYGMDKALEKLENFFLYGHIDSP